MWVFWFNRERMVEVETMQIFVWIVILCLFVGLSILGGKWLVKQHRLKQKANRAQERLENRLRQEEEDKNKPPKVIVSGNTPSKVRRGRSSVILLVDDSPTALLQLRKILERWNYKVITASNGREAWTELQKVKPDLIISDIDMPELSGIELVKLMRSDLMLMAVPVILITANVDQYLKVPQMIEVEGLLKKPFEDRVLINQLRYILQE